MKVTQNRQWVPVLLLILVCDVVSESTARGPNLEYSAGQKNKCCTKCEQGRFLCRSGKNCEEEQYCLHGDIMYGPESCVPMGATGRDHRKKLMQLLIREIAVKQWPCPIPILLDLPKDRWTAILQALYEIEEQTKAQFTFRTTEPGYLRFVDGDACQAVLGYSQSSRRIELNVGCSFGQIIHEILHAIGMHHEHSRPDRDEYIDVLFENILEQNKANFAICTDCHDEVGEYDLNSIMHYDPYAFTIRSDLKTIVPKNGNMVGVLGQRDGLSAGDIEAVNYAMFGQDCKTVLPWDTIMTNVPSPAEPVVKEEIDGPLKLANVSVGAQWVIVLVVIAACLAIIFVVYRWATGAWTCCIEGFDSLFLNRPSPDRQRLQQIQSSAVQFDSRRVQVAGSPQPTVSLPRPSKYSLPRSSQSERRRSAPRPPTIAIKIQPSVKPIISTKRSTQNAALPFKPRSPRRPKTRTPPTKPASTQSKTWKDFPDTRSQI